MINSPQTITRFELHGWTELKEELERLSKGMQRKGANYMTAAGAAYVRNIAKNKITPADAAYWAYVKEQTSDFSHMSIRGRNKKGYLRQKFQPGWVQKNIVIGHDRRQPATGSKFRIFLTPKSWFGRFVEFGAPAIGIEPRPFLIPALSNNIPGVLDTMRNALERWLLAQRFKVLKIAGK